MAPAFGLVEAKGLIPYFMTTVTKVCELRLHPILEVDRGPASSDGRQVEQHNREQRHRQVGHYRCEHVVRKGHN